MVDLSKATLTIPLGAVCGNGGFFEFRLEIAANGVGELWVRTGSGGSKFTSIHSKLDESGLADLKKTVDGIIATIAELKGDKRLERLELG